MNLIDKYELKGCNAKITIKVIRDEEALATEYLADFPSVGEGTRLTQIGRAHV